MEINIVPLHVESAELFAHAQVRSTAALRVSQVSGRLDLTQASTCNDLHSVT